jgi:hypothetical protein
MAVRKSPLATERIREALPGLVSGLCALIPTDREMTVVAENLQVVLVIKTGHASI